MLVGVFYLGLRHPYIMLHCTDNHRAASHRMHQSWWYCVVKVSARPHVFSDLHHRNLLTFSSRFSTRHLYHLSRPPWQLWHQQLLGVDRCEAVQAKYALDRRCSDEALLQLCDSFSTSAVGTNMNVTTVWYSSLKKLNISVTLVIWWLAGWQKLLRVAALLTVPPTLSQAPFPWDVARNCQSQSSPKSFLWEQRFKNLNLFFYCADEPSERYLILVSDGIFSFSRGIKAFWNAWTVAVLCLRWSEITQ